MQPGKRRQRSRGRQEKGADLCYSKSRSRPAYQVRTAKAAKNEQDPRPRLLQHRRLKLYGGKVEAVIIAPEPSKRL